MLLIEWIAIAFMSALCAWDSPLIKPAREPRRATAADWINGLSPAFVLGIASAIALGFGPYNPWTAALIGALACLSGAAFALALSLAIGANAIAYLKHVPAFAVKLVAFVVLKALIQLVRLAIHAKRAYAKADKKVVAYFAGGLLIACAVIIPGCLWTAVALCVGGGLIVSAIWCAGPSSYLGDAPENRLPTQRAVLAGEVCDGMDLCPPIAG